MTSDREAAIYTLVSQAIGMLHAAIELMEDGDMDTGCEHPEDMLRDLSTMGDSHRKIKCMKCGETFEVPVDEEERDGEAGSN